MDTDKLLDLVKRYHENREFITNEETVKMALVVPFIRYLGYDPNNPREVRLEYRADFTQGDGKRFPDAMDFAIFDKTGTRPLMVIETKPLGCDLRAKALQLARYISQMADLHFGIITDGCHYLFFGDLDNPNQMDRDPFFEFSLDDPNTDWAKVAKFLSKFSREAFNAETLVTDAENSRYRQGMIDRIVSVLRAPAEDESFMRWLTKDVYKGNRTSAVMKRLGELAREAIEPALFRVISDDFLDRLKERIVQFREAPNGQPAQATTDGSPSEQPPAGKVRREIETTAEELEFYRMVLQICTEQGTPASDVLYHDTKFWFNVSYQQPKRWFLRYLSNDRKGWKRLVTLVPVDEARQLAPGVEVDERRRKTGGSRLRIQSLAQVRDLKQIIVRSLEILKSGTKTARPQTVLTASEGSPPPASQDAARGW